MSSIESKDRQVATGSQTRLHDHGPMRSLSNSPQRVTASDQSIEHRVRRNKQTRDQNVGDLRDSFMNSGSARRLAPRTLETPTPTDRRSRSANPWNAYQGYERQPSAHTSHDRGALRTRDGRFNGPQLRVFRICALRPRRPRSGRARSKPSARSRARRTAPRAKANRTSLPQPRRTRISVRSNVRSVPTNRGHLFLGGSPRFRSTHSAMEERRLRAPANQRPGIEDSREPRDRPTCRGAIGCAPNASDSLH